MTLGRGSFTFRLYKLNNSPNKQRILCLRFSTRHEAVLPSPTRVKRQAYIPINSPSYRRKLLDSVRSSPEVVRRAMSRMTSPLIGRERRSARQREDLLVIRLLSVTSNVDTISSFQYQHDPRL